MFGWNKSYNGHSRPEHISSYLNDPTLKVSTRKTSKDDSTYETVFQTIHSSALILRVHIPHMQARNVQCKPPSMSLPGITGSHPWLDERMKVIGYGPISSEEQFMNSRLLLSQVVNAVVKHFQLHPPLNLRIVDQGLKDMQASIRNSQTTSNSQTRSTNNNSNSTTRNSNGYNRSAATRSSSTTSPPPIYTPPSPPPPPKRERSQLHFSEVVTLDSNDKLSISSKIENFSLPEPPTTYPEFNSLTPTQITNMLTDNTNLFPLLSQTPTFTQTEQIKNTILSTNQITSTMNLSKEESLSNLYDEVMELQSSLKAKVDTLESLKEKQLEICKPISKEKVLKYLKKATRESMKESDDCATAWLDSDGDGEGGDIKDVNGFIDSFLSQRIVHHVRNAKMERIQNS